jgi:large subunit ribosomal protein L36e
MIHPFVLCIPKSANIRLSQLGTFGRAKRKVDELQRVIAESRRAGH